MHIVLCTFLLRKLNYIFFLKVIIKLYIFIFQEISYDSPRGGVSVITEKGDITTSYLLIQKARVSDSGKYSCSPSNANPVFVNVHILNGKFLILFIFPTSSYDMGKPKNIEI